MKALKDRVHDPPIKMIGEKSWAQEYMEGAVTKSDYEAIRRA